MIDLHCHTDCSDGSVAPLDLVNEAICLGLRALAITDHDTLDGYDLAQPHAQQKGFELLCGVELSTRCRDSIRSAHLLGYFASAPASDPASDPSESFRFWLNSLREGRLERNLAMLRRFHELKVDISWDELQAIGKKQIGRPHFAKLLLDKGYVGSVREAFDRYLGESGLAWVDREEPALEEAIERVAAAGGIASLAHPVRISRDRAALHSLVAALIPHGLEAIECYHPEHTAADTRVCLEIAAEFDLGVTGGSDFHGSYKPDTRMGTGRDGNVHVPLAVLDDLNRRFLQKEGRQGCSSFEDNHEVQICELKS